jgi:hypothetical protein
MKRPIFVRPLSDAERKTLEAGLRSSDAFVLRRCQILLASSRGGERLPDRQKPRVQPPDRAQRHPRLQRTGASGGPSARLEASSYDSSGLRSRAGRGLTGVVAQKPSRIRQAKQPVDDGDGRRGQLRSRPYQRASKRRDRPGYAFADGGVRWERAKRWITSPDPEYARKKGGATG